MQNKPNKFPEFKEIDKEYVYFRVKERDLFKVDAYQKFIRKHLKKRHKVPLRVFDKYLSFLTDNEEVKEQFYERERIKRIEQVIDYFKNDNTYYFSGTRKEESWFQPGLWDKNKKNEAPLYINVEYSFEEMIGNVSKKLVEEMTIDPEYRTNKFKFLHLAFSHLKLYLDSNLEPKARKKYIDSRVQTIAGYMAYVFGHDIAYTAQIITKKQVLNAVRYTFDKQKKG